MTPDQLKANNLVALEETARAFGISVDEAARHISEGLMLREARRQGVPDWAIDMANAVPTNLIRDIALRDNRAPQGPSGQGIIHRASNSLVFVLLVAAAAGRLQCRYQIPRASTGSMP